MNGMGPAIGRTVTVSDNSMQASYYGSSMHAATPGIAFETFEINPVAA